MMEVDYICGAEVDSKKADQQQLTTLYNDRTYHFCSKECKDQFDRNPSVYASPGPDLSDGEDRYMY